MARSSQPLPYLLVLYGFFLVALSFWLVSAELSRTNVTTLPMSAESAAAAAQRNGQALTVARFGGLRGDLWSQLAFTYATLEWPKPAMPTSSLDAARHAATRAVTLKPVNPSVWLLFADLASRYPQDNPSPAESLKMSYYTGPHEDGLIPLRLAVSSRLDVAADPELERLFRRELEYVMSYRPNLKPAIVAAYVQASPQARRTIESTTNDIDPPFAKSLTSANKP
jgi:hypothetical protein